MANAKQQAKQKIEKITNREVRELRPLSGGCVGDVYRVHMENGADLVVKLGQMGSGLELEGYCLNHLSTHGDLPVPDVLFASDEILLMTYLESGESIGHGAAAHAGELVAHMHLVSAQGGFGFEKDTTIGGLHQPNPWNKNWVDFFKDHRLLYMGGVAMEAGNLPGAIFSRLEKFTGDLDRWIETPEKSSLIHGDMWTGNVLAANGRISGFVDPAAYYADAEIELAFTQMFGTFNQIFFDSYKNIRPIKPGFFEERLSIYNLYPLLVHVRLFGGGYVNSIDGTLRKFGY
ncbi:MAG: fructosamine kinase family protein [Rhodospirillaceae bacterium]|nr:fructosamine kinase family protein [Rhodospirillaceae bacterium]